MSTRRVLVGLAAAALVVNALLVVDALSFGVLVPAAEAKGSVRAPAHQAGARPAAPAAGTAAVPAPSPASTARSAPEGPVSIAPSPAVPATGVREAEAAYRALVEQLQQQKQRLDRREGELAERERRLAVARPGPEAAPGEADTVPVPERGARAATAAPKHAAFERLLRAYDGMDPANAAASLVRLYRREPQVVIEVLLGMKPRQSAAALDAIAATDPAIAAELSLEIWRRER